METCFNYCDKDVAFFSSDERKWINKIHKLKKEHPDEITIIREPEVNDGCIYARVPTFILNLNFPRRVVLTEEQRQERAARLQAIRESRAEIRKND